MSKAYNIIEASNMTGEEFEVVYANGSKRKNNLIACESKLLVAGSTEEVNGLCRDLINAKFYKVQKPIDFFEAMKLVSEGKKVKNKFGIFKKVGGGLNRGLSGEESGDVWYLVDEDNSVSFIEAIKASQEGMVIHVDAGEKSYTYYPKDDRFSELTAVETKGGLSTHEILSGKWYIEGK